MTVCYHGRRDPRGGTQVLVHYPRTGWLVQLPHIVKHSPAGLDWGYLGSGPADLARSLIIHAARRWTWCLDCGGPEGGGCRWCDGGYRPIPYQRFKEQYVADWPDTWMIGRRTILRWLREHLDAPW